MTPGGTLDAPEVVAPTDAGLPTRFMECPAGCVLWKEQHPSQNEMEQVLERERKRTCLSIVSWSCIANVFRLFPVRIHASLVPYFGASNTRALSCRQRRYLQSKDDRGSVNLPILPIFRLLWTRFMHRRVPDLRFAGHFHPDEYHLGARSTVVIVDCGQVFP